MKWNKPNGAECDKQKRIWQVRMKVGACFVSSQPSWDDLSLSLRQKKNTETKWLLSRPRSCGEAQTLLTKPHHPNSVVFVDHLLLLFVWVFFNKEETSWFLSSFSSAALLDLLSFTSCLTCLVKPVERLSTQIARRYEHKSPTDLNLV